MSVDAPVIRPATTVGDYEAFGRVCHLYVDWCRHLYGDMSWFIDEVFSSQSLDEELTGLAVTYGPPNGRALIVTRDGEAIAGGAYRRWSDTECELKRLFVTDRARGLGLGRRLTDTLLDLARADGYGGMKLDTCSRMVEAIAMYRSIGFAPVPPYQAYADRLLPHLVFMHRPL